MLTLDEDGNIARIVVRSAPDDSRLVVELDVAPARQRPLSRVERLLSLTAGRRESGRGLGAGRVGSGILGRSNGETLPRHPERPP